MVSSTASAIPASGRKKKRQPAEYKMARGAFWLRLSVLVAGSRSAAFGEIMSGANAITRKSMHEKYKGDPDKAFADLFPPPDAKEAPAK